MQVIAVAVAVWLVLPAVVFGSMYGYMEREDRKRTAAIQARQAYQSALYVSAVESGRL